MGACGSVHKESGSAAMKLEMSFRSKPNKLSSSIPPSPVKDKPPPTTTTNDDRPINDQWLTPSPPVTTFRDYGSKDEAFFDSKPWLDSDCESDFYSVNGDFTPSRGNTPVHHNFSQVNNTPFGNRYPVSFPPPSPPQKKKKLAELFRESFRDANNAVDAVDTPGNQTLTDGKLEAQNHPTKSLNGTPYASGSERSAEDASAKETPFKSMQCCLPTFASFRSTSQRRKMSPTIAVVGKA